MDESNMPVEATLDTEAKATVAALERFIASVTPNMILHMNLGARRVLAHQTFEHLGGFTGEGMQSF